MFFAVEKVPHPLQSAPAAIASNGMEGTHQ
jgi:hypothetical protein